MYSAACLILAGFVYMAIMYIARRRKHKTHQACDKGHRWTKTWRDDSEKRYCTVCGLRQYFGKGAWREDKKGSQWIELS